MNKNLSKGGADGRVWKLSQAVFCGRNSNYYRNAGVQS